MPIFSLPRRDLLLLRAYNVLVVLLCPVVLPKKWLKFRRYGYAYEWNAARWSITFSPAPKPEETPENPCITLLALGWTEVAIVDKISRRLEAERPDLRLVWMIRDVEARAMAHRAFPTRTIVPMPFDFSVPARRFLAKVRPDALIVVEKFWWPNLVWGANLAGAKVILVNGRSRGREKGRYKLLGGFQKWVLRAFDLLLFESESQIERVREVLPAQARAIATGNIKWSSEVPTAPAQAGTLEAWLGARARDENGPLPLFFAGSTTSEDEHWAVEAWQIARKQGRCALLLAPRSPHRGLEVEKWLLERGFTSSLRSAPRPDCEILILDTLGELAYAYRFASAAYVGGAISGRGHNIIEPLLWGVAVGYGPNRGDFEAAQKAAEAAEVGFRLENAAQLAQFWVNCQDKQAREQFQRRAAVLLETQNMAFDRILKELLSCLEDLNRENSMEKRVDVNYVRRR